MLPIDELKALALNLETDHRLSIDPAKGGELVRQAILALELAHAVGLAPRRGTPSSEGERERANDALNHFFAEPGKAAPVEELPTPGRETRAFAVVTAELEVHLATPWGGEAAVDQVFKTAVLDATDRLQNLLSRAKAGDVRLRRHVEQSDVRMIVVGKDPRR